MSEIKPIKIELDQPVDTIYISTVPQSEPPAPEVEPIWDAVSQKRIDELHPLLRDLAIDMVNQVDARLGIRLRVTSGLRTFAEQEALYARGRTKKGPKVTNAKPGQSYHNYGLAFDVVEILNGHAVWDADWAAIGAVGKSLGLEWGGDWARFRDRPHFQLSFGLSTSELLERYDTKMFDEFGYVDLSDILRQTA